jgi:hypothetical protein
VPRWYQEQTLGKTIAYDNKGFLQQGIVTQPIREFALWKQGIQRGIIREIEADHWGLDSHRSKGYLLGPMKPNVRLLFKRNQVMEAIARVLQHESTTLDSDLHSRIKRLLEIDRRRRRNRRSTDPEQARFAFYSADMPGRGHENQFTQFECFTILTGLRLMGHGWPQGTVVALLRRLRPELEKHHTRLLRQGPAALYNEQQLRGGAQPGDMAVDTLDPLFIVIVSEQGRTGSRSSALCRGQRELFELYHRYGPGYAFTLIELATSIHALSLALAQTKPRPRGRSRT